MRPSSQPKQLTDDLLATQKLLRATLDASMDMIQVFEAVRNEQGQIIDFTWILNNHTAETIYGDVVGKSLLQLQPGVVAEGIFEAFTQVVETGLPQQYEKQYIHEQFHGWFHQSVVKLNDGVATTTADITPRKRAQEQLQQSQALLQSVIDSSLDIIQVFKAVRDETGAILDFVWVMNNQKAAVQNGEVIGKSLLKLNPGVVTSGIFDDMVEVAQTGVAYEREQHYNHEQFDGWFYQALVKTDDGVAMTTRDISRQKQAEREVLRLKDEIAQKATDKYQALFNAIDQGFNLIELIFDDQGHVMDYWQREHNPVFTRMTGLNDAIGKRMSELVPYVEPEWHQMIERIYYTGEPIRLEYPVRALGQWFTAYMSRVGDAGSPFVACLYDDITERKQREQHQAFLLHFFDDLRAEPDADTIANRALQLLADHLQLDRCYVGVYQLAEDRGVFPYQVGNDQVPPMPNQGVRLSDFPQALQITFNQTLVIPDFQHTDGLSEVDKRNFAALGFGALVVATVRKGEKNPHWAINAVSARPRPWTDLEIQLVEEVTERTWAALEWAKAQEVLRHNEERMRLAVEAAQLATWVWNLESDQVLWNPQHFRLLGMPLQDEPLQAAAFLNRIHPEDQPRVTEELTRAVDQQTLFATEFRIVRDDGTTRWMSGYGRVTGYQVGKPTQMSGAMLDITQRKEAEVALRQSEERQAFLLSLSDAVRHLQNPVDIQYQALKLLAQRLAVERVGYYELDEDEDGFVVTASYGRNPAPFPARGRLSSFDPNLLALYRAGRTITEVDTDQLPAESLRDAYRAVGIRAWAVVPLVKDGHLRSAIGIQSAVAREWTPTELQILEDVAERTWEAVERAKAQEAMRASNDRLQKAFSIETVGVIFFDQHGLIQDVNPAFRHMSGLPPEELVGGKIHWQDLTPPEFMEFSQLSLAELLSNGQSTPYEKQYIRPDGSRWWGLFAGKQVSAHEIVEFVLDITQTKQAEEALRASQQRFESIANLVPDLLWESDPDGSTNWYNQRWLEYTGQRFDQAIGWGWTNAIHPDDRDASVRRYGQAVEAGQPLQLEERIRRHDGAYRWFVVNASPLKDEQGRVVNMYGAATDIHDRKQAEEALQEADRRKDEFLAMLAHELRNPMSTLRSGLQILPLATGIDQLNSEILAMMSRQTEHLVRMVDDLLDVSRISRGKIEIQQEPVNLVELVRQALLSLADQFEQQHKVLDARLPGTPITLAGDATRLTQVVVNLLTNGLRYSGEGGQVWLSLEHRGQEAILQVRDNGIGLAADQLSAIFELFVQVDNSTARSKGGLGLGLTLVKRLVEMHGGRVEAYSEGLGQGSTFTVHLPTLTSAAEPMAQPAPQATQPTAANRILVIDDNADAAMTLAMILKLKGYEAHSRTSGQAGIEAAEQLQPAAILLDIGMPQMDGYKTCQLIREQSWGMAVVVIALTGYGQEEDRQRTRAAGFDGHLVKPVDLAALTRLLTDLLDKGSN